MVVNTIRNWTTCSMSAKIFPIDQQILKRYQNSAADWVYLSWSYDNLDQKPQLSLISSIIIENKNKMNYKYNSWSELRAHNRIYHEPLNFLHNCGLWWLCGRFGAMRPEGRGFESHSSRHIGTSGKSFTRSCLWRFRMELWHSIRAVFSAIELLLKLYHLRIVVKVV